ncbi:DUF402 domain-containing protein [Halobacteriales archaeon Cl-PHB]
MTVRVRGIYTTALTHLLDGVVQASPPIQDRFDADLPEERAATRLDTTRDRQGAAVVGDGDRVTEVVTTLADLGRDTFTWDADLPSGAVYAGEVTETLGGGAVVDVGDGEGYLPFSATSRRIETGDELRVQVTDPRPPWGDGRPELDTTVRIEGGLASLVRGRTTGSAGPELADLLSVEPPAGWGIDWDRGAEEAGLDALGEVLAALSKRAERLDAALKDAPAPTEAAPHRYWDGEATRWVWFGRETRVALDGVRDEVTPTMPGHHRIKAGSRKASAAVDLVEAVCDFDGDAEGDEAGGPDGAFPFTAVTRQFGPQVGDSVALAHGKPDGRCFDLGPGEVVGRDADGTVTLEREMTPGGTYDALGIERQAGDVATTKVREGRWWYPTVYRSAEGDRRGTYVNVCTPVEVFPDELRYVDLHVDVVKHADGRVERVDDDELDEAVENGYVSEALAEKARSVATAVESALGE